MEHTTCSSTMLSFVSLWYLSYFFQKYEFEFTF